MKVTKQELKETIGYYLATKGEQVTNTILNLCDAYASTSRVRYLLGEMVEDKHIKESKTPGEVSRWAITELGKKAYLKTDAPDTEEKPKQLPDVPNLPTTEERFEHKIEQEIVGYKVVTKEQTSSTQTEETKPIIESREILHEGMPRPEVLQGTTYKIKPPVSEHAIYITINNVVLNVGESDETVAPFEIFLNSKNMDNFQWVSAMTRLISAVWRKGGNAIFIIEELKGVFDPRGGYFKRGGVFMPSVVAEIGHVIEQHLQGLGLVTTKLDEARIAFVESKKEELGVIDTYPAHATVCKICSVKSVVRIDNCETCLNCGESKCG